MQEKVDTVHDLVADEQVGTRVATDLLRRQSEAFKALTDDTANLSHRRLLLGCCRRREFLACLTVP